MIHVGKVIGAFQRTGKALLGDAQSTPQAGTAEIEKMNEAGCSAVVGAFASAICLATTQAAAKHGLPHVVDIRNFGLVGGIELADGVLYAWDLTGGDTEFIKP